MVSATEYRNRKSVLRKDPVQLGEAQMHENHAAIVFDTTVGGPAVSPSGHARHKEQISGEEFFPIHMRRFLPPHINPTLLRL